jgi:hypothetical protein
MLDDDQQEKFMTILWSVTDKIEALWRVEGDYDIDELRFMRIKFY